MKRTTLTTLLATLSLLAAATPAATQAQAPAAHYTTGETDIGTLLDDPASRAVLDKHVPGLSSEPQIGMARGMTLKAVQSYSADKFTDEVLAKIDADLAKLPAKK